ncbi:toll/interleukin-1 receptor domain-containing protein [Clavibacter michiganensis]|uniref:toll/interleukin-1 receptor domain-containing protein n=1 Tax=Clavibacter michiganensis TaxID=28447 RepID=UPI003EB81C26
MSTLNAVRVFISYAHDDGVPGHADRALELADSLRRRGVLSFIDKWVEHEPIHWPRWMADQIRDADYVLCLGSPLYKMRSEQNGDPDTGRGARWEGALITDAMYSDIAGAPAKFLSVVMESTTPDDLPDVLRPYGHTYYKWSPGSDGDEALYRRLTGQPRFTPPPLGPLVVFD